MLQNQIQYLILGDDSQELLDKILCCQISIAFTKSFNDFILGTATQYDLVLCYFNAFIGVPYMYTLTYSCSVHGSNFIVLFRKNPRVQVPSSTLFTMFFSEQRINIASFLIILRGWNGTILELVSLFCKADCPKYKTRVIP